MGDNLVRIGMGEMITRELGLGMLLLQSQTLLGERTRIRHPTKDCRVVPRNVNPVNARNPAASRGACFECGAIDGGQGRGNNDNQARRRAFMLGVEEARKTR
ncbi:hypothetical protein Tco_1350900, partial [Tanacetum coccineum]